MSSGDPIGDLVNLARAAAESGYDWRAELRASWLPRLLSTTHEGILRVALSEWDHEATVAGDLADAIEAAVLAAMAGEGYD